MNKKQALLCAVTALATTLVGCSRNVINQSELASVKRVAVVMYSVPSTIVVDSRKPEEIAEDKGRVIDAFSLASSMLEGTAKSVVDTFDSTSHVQKEISGTQAANISLAAMISELSTENQWSFVLPTEVAANEVYQQQSLLLANSQRFKLESSTRRAAGVPTGYINLGLPHGHGEVMTYQDTPEFKAWAAKVTRALNVDAVIVVSDTGYATDSKSLFRGGACITKSAMHYAMFNVNGEQIVDTRVSFEEAPEIEQSGCVSGSFYKSDYKGALVVHGTEQGRVIAEKLRES